MKQLHNTLSLYIHVPFCISKCAYCDFYSQGFTEPAADRFIDALVKEWQICLDMGLMLPGSRISTVYFGGGTPSIFTARQWNRLQREFMSVVPLADAAEVTIECNPDSFTSDKAHAWLDAGVNRLSLGIQSLNAQELTLLGRCHSAASALRVLEDPRLFRFNSVGVDLMYGLPGQTLASLNATLEGILTCDLLRHLSAYEITLSPNSPFHARAQGVPFPEEPTVVDMLSLISQGAASRGMYRYEISNWALPGHECRHNIVYWQHKPYLGLGPAAHSFMRGKRTSNVADVQSYCDALLLHHRRPVYFEETLTAEMLVRETIYTRLRTAQGLNEEEFYALTGTIFYEPNRAEILSALIRDGYMYVKRPVWILTEKGMLMADAITQKLI